MPSRRDFLRLSGLGALEIFGARRHARAWRPRPANERGPGPAVDRRRRVTLFLCGDVMTGRAIDQVLPHPSAPRLHEGWARSALDYVDLAERAHGPIPRSVPPGYIWGDALELLDHAAPDLRIVNLETSVTTSDEWQPKGINYRMHPANVGCLTAAKIDCCVLANNHVLDWGRAGLRETLAVLRRAGLATAGAGESAAEATRPATLDAPGRGRVLVWAWGSPTSGIPRDWQAAEEQPGVALLADLSPATARRIAGEIRRHRRPQDVVVVSLHWGSNWGYEIPSVQRRLARMLISDGAVDIVHGHSSRHPKGIEVFRGRPILYGCGDFLNDYEGIRGHEEFRSDLVLGYLVTLDPSSGRLDALEMIPFRIRRFRLDRASPEQTRWLGETLDRECRSLGSRVTAADDGRLALRWSRDTGAS